MYFIQFYAIATVTLRVVERNSRSTVIREVHESLVSDDLTSE
jgi:hypothetical protein